MRSFSGFIRDKLDSRGGGGKKSGVRVRVNEISSILLPRREESEILYKH